MERIHRHADRLTPEQYVKEVMARQFISDPRLSFQLKQDFLPLAVAPGDLHHGPESLGYAAVIEWLNPEVAKPEDYAVRSTSFRED